MRRLETSRSNQRGAVLAVSLILLLAITLIIVTASNIVEGDLKIVKNTESRDMVRFAANAAIEEALSSDRFASSPDSIFLLDCGDNKKCYDINGDGVDDITVEVSTPSCVIVTPIENKDLDVFGSAADASCFLPPETYSMCANSVWEFEATATDGVTGAQITVKQGVSILTTLNNVDTACPV
jgi:hypothetical protein